ncbi:leucine-rich repeat protein kinase family protein [Striga asiatica]|uniref:Leucine-rich repeat protein kinase family protein n=1 Tax=Striga asiatica TaxID=4170 RepID=A0A5A7P0X4_STRAF|nr:leucine-rich repeat protein kinase family protein [Striga asiatica]
MGSDYDEAKAKTMKPSTVKEARNQSRSPGFPPKQFISYITSKVTANEGEGYGPDDGSLKPRISKEALAELLKVVESNVSTRQSFQSSRASMISFSSFIGKMVKKSFNTSADPRGLKCPSTGDALSPEPEKFLYHHESAE